MIRLRTSKVAWRVCEQREGVRFPISPKRKSEVLRAEAYGGSSSEEADRTARLPRSEEQSMTSLPNSLGHLGPMVETHASWVFLGAEFVFKFKKPVDFGFLDFSTLEKRKAACEAELRLNARLSPDVYLGLVEVRSTDGEVFVRAPAPDAVSTRGSDDRLMDYGIKMRRLDDALRSDSLLEKGDLSLSRVDALAQVLADFHDGCETSERIAAFGTLEAISRNVEENFAQARPFIGDHVPLATVDEIEAGQRGFLKKSAALLLERVKHGFIRDGHGDLRLDHIYFEESGIRIIDCIEFNERFRFADTCADLAFLVMDLRHKGRNDLAERLLAHYARLTRDYQLYAAVDFYESYRAYVRGKVATFRLQQESDLGKRSRLSQTASEYFEHAARALRPPLARPRLICVGGLIASGKSTVAARLSESTCTVVIDSDRTRKHLAGLAPEEPSRDEAFSGTYTPEFTRRVYDRLIESARMVLASGRSVIAEATFGKRDERCRFAHLAETLGIEMAFIECRVADAVARERLVRRSQKKSVSDGRSEIYDAIKRAFEPIEADEFVCLLVLDTESSEDEQDVTLSNFGLM